MQTRASIRTVTGLLFALVASLLYVPAAEAAPLVAPSTVWGHTYAAEASGVVSVPAAQPANLERLSKFVVNYKNFPDWAKNEVQAAIDQARVITKETTENLTKREVARLLTLLDKL